MGQVVRLKTAGSDRLSRTFAETGDFIAYGLATSYLTVRGFSIGRMQAHSPTGVLLGDFDIQKWKNLSAEDRNDLHAQITGDFRAGPVTITLRRDVHSTVIEAFNAKIEEPTNIVSLDSARGSPGDGRPDAAAMGFDVADAHEVIDPPGVFADDGKPRAVRISAGDDLAAQHFVERGSKP